MKKTQIASLSLAVMSIMTLGISQAVAQTEEQSTVSTVVKSNPYNYPTTRTHSEKKDLFLSGEMGRPAGLVGENINSRNAVLDNSRAKPDTGENVFFTEKVKDKYRWLENVDMIYPEYLYEKSADRQRNFIGTRQEDERPNGQLDNRTRESLQTVNENSPKSEVTQWVDAQNKATWDYLHTLPNLPAITENVSSLYDYKHTIRKVKKPSIGELHLFRDTDGYQKVVRTDKEGNQAQLWAETDLEYGLRNNKGDFYVSKDGSYFAIILSTGGSDSDDVSIHVFDSATGKPLDVIKNIGAQVDSGRHMVEWIDDKTFYYVQTKRSGPIGILSHTIGKKGLNDPLVISTADLDSPYHYINSFWFTGENDRYLIMALMINAGEENAFFIKDTKTGKFYRPYDKRTADKNRDYGEVFLIGKFVHLDDKTGDVWLISGEHDDEKGEIVKTNLNNLKKREVVVAVNNNYDSIVEAVYHAEGNGYFVIVYRKDGQHRVVMTDAHGQVLKDITPAPTGNATDLYSHIAGDNSATNRAASTTDSVIKAEDGSYISFRFQNFALPRTVYKYSIAKGDFIDIRRRDLYPFDESQYTSEVVKYKSKDGTEIPMSLTYKKGMIRDGKNPTMMLSYGGFGVPLNTRFGMRTAVWLEHGGIYAQPHIRGDNDYGDKWHTDGNLLNKMNVFNDFEAAADYLNEQGYASPDYLMISGGSNGGLLIGAAMTQAPHKYKVAIPAVGVLDMLRHNEKYYLGNWSQEYGTAHDSKKMYDVLKSYSPYHNVKAGECYPATMVTTSKRDDRVLPFHSYKFVAALQENQGCDNPTFLFADEIAGHGTITSRQVKEYAAVTTAFTLHQMGIDTVPTPTRPSIEQLKGEKWLKEEAEANAK